MVLWGQEGITKRQEKTEGDGYIPAALTVQIVSWIYIFMSEIIKLYLKYLFFIVNEFYLNKAIFLKCDFQK